LGKSGPGAWLPARPHPLLDQGGQRPVSAPDGLSAYDPEPMLRGCSPAQDPPSGAQV